MPGSSLIASIALLGLFLGLWLLLAGRSMRRRRGLGDGQTVSLDRVTLRSKRLGLVGRPDRIIRSGDTLIIEEWKSGRMLQPWHQAQMGVYFLLAEEQLGMRPSHGFLVTGDGRRHRVENEERLRAWVLEMGEKIRQRRQNVEQPIAVNPATWQCRACGLRGHCPQHRL